MTSQSILLDKNLTNNSRSLSGNKITSTGASSLFKAIESHRFLASINIRDNEIGNECLTDLGNLLSKNKSIHKIDIGGSNTINDEGVNVLFPFLVNFSSLHVLILSDAGGITDASVPVLTNILNNSKIQMIDIRGTSITDQFVLLHTTLKNQLKNEQAEIDVSKW